MYTSKFVDAVLDSTPLDFCIVKNRNVKYVGIVYPNGFIDWSNETEINSSLNTMQRCGTDIALVNAVRVCLDRSEIVVSFNQ